MREKIRVVAENAWRYVNTHVGAAILGAGIAHLFTRGTKEKELQEN